MTTRPKYTAASEFSVAGHKYVVGDPVDNPIALDAVLRFGDRFVKTNTKRASAKPANADPAPADLKEK